jgi:ATP phosphoribosyltransferase
VDLVSTGNTLRANHLKAVEEVAEISSRLVINQASFKLKREMLQPVMDGFGQAVSRKE